MITGKRLGPAKVLWLMTIVALIAAAVIGVALPADTVSIANESLVSSPAFEGIVQLETTGYEATGGANDEFAVDLTTPNQLSSPMAKSPDVTTTINDVVSDSDVSAVPDLTATGSIAFAEFTPTYTAIMAATTNTVTTIIAGGVDIDYAGSSSGAVPIWQLSVDGPRPITITSARAIPDVTITFYSTGSDGVSVPISKWTASQPTRASGSDGYQLTRAVTTDSGSTTPSVVITTTVNITNGMSTAI